ncbi:MAG: hypothetical protein WBS19_21020 [Candidatus Korobacteraceae bacterium]
MRTTGPIEVIARHRNSRRVAWLVLTLAALVAIGTLSGCETSTAATNAATQLSKVSQQLSDYYADLSNQVDDTVALNQVQAELLGLPFDDSDHARLNTTKQEIGKRAAMAKALGALASAYATLAGSKSAADIGTAASGLAKACESIKAIPGGGGLPDVFAQASQQLVELIRARKLRQSSGAIGKAVAAIDTLFEQESPVYESINRQRITLAQSLAVMLLQKDMVDVNPVLAPALKPFDLTSKLPANQTPAEMRHLAELKIQATGDNQINTYQANTTALAAALKSASQQVEAVARKH